MAAARVIPIFPLDLVLFPRQELPLRIFEPRYKQLVDDCMLGDGQFGVCLVDGASQVAGWNAPRRVGTVAKITRCSDVGIDGMQQQIETTGRGRFAIKRLIEPAVAQPEGYDPVSAAGHTEVSRLHEGVGTAEKMYIRAEVEMIPEIDESVPSDRWEGLVGLWKKKIARQALPQVVEPGALNQMLRQYYLETDTPTVDYVYSLAALGAGSPGDLQPLLEASDMSELLARVEGLLGA